MRKFVRDVRIGDVILIPENDKQWLVHEVKPYMSDDMLSLGMTVFGTHGMREFWYTYNKNDELPHVCSVRQSTFYNLEKWADDIDRWDYLERFRDQVEAIEKCDDYRRQMPDDVFRVEETTTVRISRDVH